jgi:CheY-like chemotaxis protein
LPDIGGLEFIERVRSNPGWQHIPIVIVSAQGEADGMEVLKGAMSITKADGMMPGEVVRWVQNVVDTAVTSLPAPPAPRAVPASTRAFPERQ